VSYLIKYGPAFMKKLDRAVVLDEDDHQVMIMD
jgi:hypothetical protein